MGNPSSSPRKTHYQVHLNHLDCCKGDFPMDIVGFKVRSTYSLRSHIVALPGP